MAQEEVRSISVLNITPLSRTQRRTIIVSSLLVFDVLALGLAFFLAFWFRFRFLDYSAEFRESDYQWLALGMVLSWILIFIVYGLYDQKLLFGGLKEYTQVFNAVVTGLVTTVLFDFLSRSNWTVSRGWLILAGGLALLFVIVGRFGMRRWVYFLRRRGHLLSPALIVGANAEGQALAQQLRLWATSGLYICGFVDNFTPLNEKVANEFPVLGRFRDLEAIIQQKNVQEVIIANTALDRAEFVDLYRRLGSNPQINLRLSSGLFEILSTGLQIKEIAFVPLIEVNKTRIAGLDAFMKAVLDYGISIPILLLGWPFLLLLALLVKLDSPGPVIYRRRVMGVNGVQLDAFKFRTMYINGDEILEQYPHFKEELAHEYKLKEDPRVTRLGKVLRKFSLDELPQLFNVLRGEMSLIGPRMISPPEMHEYGKWGMNLLTVKPGITGLWQVSGRSDVTYEERVRLDMQYIRNWSIWTDLYILFATLPAVIFKRGAY